MRFTDLMDEFKWVLNVLDSVDSRKQLKCARNLYYCWKNKYSDFDVFDLYQKFEENFSVKEVSLFNIEFSSKI
jgi:hypothetical protein